MRVNSNIALSFAVLCGMALPRLVHAAPCTLTAEDIDAYLQEQGSPLAGQGASFIKYGEAWNVDPRLIIAIAGAESTLGRSVCAPHNAWGYFYGGSCANSPFDSWDRAIETVTKWIRLRYLAIGKTIPTFNELPNPRYCVDGCEHWVGNVTSYYQGLGGDMNDLGCAPECEAASCGNFVECATPSAACSNPVCTRLADSGSGLCVEGSTSCSGLRTCQRQRDCIGTLETSACLLDTCCGEGVCVPQTAFCSSNASGGVGQLRSFAPYAEGATLAAP